MQVLMAIMTPPLSPLEQASERKNEDCAQGEQLLGATFAQHLVGVPRKITHLRNFVASMHDENFFVMHGPHKIPQMQHFAWGTSAQAHSAFANTHPFCHGLFDSVLKPSRLRFPQ